VTAFGFFRVVLSIALVFECVSHATAARADEPWYYGSVVCKGDEALVRFVLTYNDDLPDFSQVPMPPGAEFDQVPIADPSKCILANGRVVVLRHINLGDALPFGMCGGDSQQAFSLWIGGRKVFSRQIFHTKCGPDAVAIWIHGKTLTWCALAIDPQRTFQCDDASDLPSHPAQDASPLGTLKLLRHEAAMEWFCKSLVTRAVPPELVPLPHPWKAYAGGPIETISDAKERNQVYSGTDPQVWPLAFGNGIKPSQIMLFEDTSTSFFGAFWEIVGQASSEDEWRSARDKFRFDPDAELPKARKVGARIFAGDQTAYKSAGQVWLFPFVRNGRTWMHAKWAWQSMISTDDPTMADQATDIILRPTPAGELQEVCAFKAIPPI
jgi:hypothetical protein